MFIDQQIGINETPDVFSYQAHTHVQKQQKKAVATRPLYYIAIALHELYGNTNYDTRVHHYNV